MHTDDQRIVADSVLQHISVRDFLDARPVATPVRSEANTDRELEHAREMIAFLELELGLR